jgi:oligosaccharide repeat unit polymerase
MLGRKTIRQIRVLRPSSSLLFYLAIQIGLVILIISGVLNDVVQIIYAEKLLRYSILFVVLSFVCLCIVVYKNNQYTPSILLFAIFLAVPILGYFSYEIFIDLHGTFFGQLLTFDFPFFVWSLGMFVFFAGTLFSHFLFRFRNRKVHSAWSLTRLSFLLWLILGISTIAAVVVIARIGYLPILESGISVVRGNYEDIAGRYPTKLARLFIVASLFASTLFFLTKKRRYLIVLLLTSVGLTLYGERLYLFWAIIFHCLIYLKFHKPRIRQLVGYAVLGFCFVALLLVFAERRAGRLDGDISLKEHIALPIFSEYSYYAYVVNDVSISGEFLEEDIFLNALVRLFPRQIWSFIGVDKDFVMQNYSAIRYFGEQFREHMGVRITPVGEAYAGYGIAGVVVQMLLLGIVFGVLEGAYMSLDKLDVRQCLVSFLLTLFMWIPIATLSVIVDPFIFYGEIIFVCILLGKRKVFDVVKDNTFRQSPEAQY